MSNEEIKHYGIPGMKWGVRRYQNEDGSLTPLGKRRKGEEIDAVNAHYNKQKAYQRKKIDKINKYFKEGKRSEKKDAKMKNRLDKHKTYLKAYKNLANDEIKKIKKTPIKELMNSRFNQRGKAIAGTILLNGIGALSLNTLGIGIVGAYLPNNNFLTMEERTKAIQRAGNLSAREFSSIYRHGSFRGINRRSKKK